MALQYCSGVTVHGESVYQRANELPTCGLPPHSRGFGSLRDSRTRGSDRLLGKDSFFGPARPGEARGLEAQGASARPGSAPLGGQGWCDLTEELAAIAIRHHSLMQKARWRKQLRG